MTTPGLQTFAVTLVQLTPDGKKAGAEFSTTERTGVTFKELRSILFAAAELAPKVFYPLAPEIRINGPTGKFVIRVKDGKLHFVSWSSAKASSVEPKVDEILAIIGGDIAESAGGETAGGSASEAGAKKGWMGITAIYALVIVVVGLNVRTIMVDRRPPGNFLPPYRLIEAEPGERLLVDVAGTYETGRTPGSRRLQISRDGAVKWVKIGPDNSTTEEKTMTVKASEANGTKALLTSRQSMITIKSPTSLELFGDTYNRIVK